MWSIRSQGVGQPGRLAGGPAIGGRPVHQHRDGRIAFGQAVQGPDGAFGTAERAPLAVQLFDGQDPLSCVRGHGRNPASATSPDPSHRRGMSAPDSVTRRATSGRDNLPRWISKSSTTVTPGAGPRRRSSWAPSGTTRTAAATRSTGSRTPESSTSCAEPAPHIVEDPFGGTALVDRPQPKRSKMTVDVVAQVATHDELEKVLAGWQEAMAGDAGAEWLAERLRSPAWRSAPGRVPCPTPTRRAPRLHA